MVEYVQDEDRGLTARGDGMKKIEGLEVGVSLRCDKEAV